MSFSNELKNIIVREMSLYPRRNKRFISGILQSSAKLESDVLGNKKLKISTENVALIKFIKVYFDKNEMYEGLAKIQKVKKARNKSRYSVYLTLADKVLDMYGLKYEGCNISSEFPDEIKEKVQRKKDYVAGFFLGAGYISSPEKSYHLEFVCKDLEQAKNLIMILSDLSISAKWVKRGNFFLVYIKDSDTIADLLTVMGADSKRFVFEETKIIKAIRNNVNRQVNCDTANLNRIVKVAGRQIDAINLIDKSIGLDSLEDRLRQIAELRLEYPEMSLGELGSIMNPPMGKSGVNHRLIKIEKIAKNLEDGAKNGIS